MFTHSSQRGVDVMYYATERGVRPMFPERRAKAWLARGGQSAIEDDDEALPRLSTLPRASTPTTLATIKSQEQLEPPRRASSGAATAPVPTDYNDLDKVVERVSSNSSTASSRRTMSEARTRLLSPLRPGRILRRDGQRCCGVARHIIEIAAPGVGQAG